MPADRALGFYAIVAAATLGGGALAATNIDPIAMLFWTAVINGVVAVPIMVAMMLVVSRTTGKGAISLPRWVKILGWLTAGLMALAVGLLAWSSSVFRNTYRPIAQGRRLWILTHVDHWSPGASRAGSASAAGPLRCLNFCLDRRFDPSLSSPKQRPRTDQ